MVPNWEGEEVKSDWTYIYTHKRPLAPPSWMLASRCLGCDRHEKTVDNPQAVHFSLGSWGAYTTERGNHEGRAQTIKTSHAIILRTNKQAVTDVSKLSFSEKTDHIGIYPQVDKAVSRSPESANAATASFPSACDFRWKTTPKTDRVRQRPIIRRPTPTTLSQEKRPSHSEREQIFCSTVRTARVGWFFGYGGVAAAFLTNSRMNGYTARRREGAISRVIDHQVWGRL